MTLHQLITTAGRWVGVLGILASFLFIGVGTARAEGSEAPSVTAYPNAPGWITVAWQHSGIDVYWYNIERGDRADVVRREYGASGTFTDTNLQATTQYSYRVCAVYDVNQACSEWKSARTLSSQPPPPAGGSAPAPTAPPMRVYLTATPQRPTAIALQFSVEGVAETANDRFVIFRHNPLDTNLSSIYGEERRPVLRGLTGAFTDTNVKANTKYFYSACFQVGISSSFDLCSSLVNATVAVPLPPTPTNLHVKEKGLAQLELAWTPNITDGLATTEFDIYRDGVRVKTQVWYPVENHFFDAVRVGVVLYKVCAVDQRGTHDEVQSCTADLKVMSYAAGSTEFNPNRVPAARQP